MICPLCLQNSKLILKQKQPVKMTTFNSFKFYDQIYISLVQIYTNLLLWCNVMLLSYNLSMCSLHILDCSELWLWHSNNRLNILCLDEGVSGMPIGWTGGIAGYEMVNRMSCSSLQHSKTCSLVSYPLLCLLHQPPPPSLLKPTPPIPAIDPSFIYHTDALAVCRRLPRKAS